MFFDNSEDKVYSSGIRKYVRSGAFSDAETWLGLFHSGAASGSRKRKH